MSAFTPVELIPVLSAKFSCLEPRALVLPKPVNFLLDAQIADVVLAKARTTKDYEKEHQVVPTWPSSMASVMPDVERARTSGNPYPTFSADVSADTVSRYAPYQAILSKVWTVLQNSPITGAEMIVLLSKQLPEVAQLDNTKGQKEYFKATVMNTLRDLSLYGLACRDSVKVRYDKTKWKAIDPRSIAIVEPSQKVPQKPKKSRASGKPKVSETETTVSEMSTE